MDEEAGFDKYSMMNPGSGFWGCLGHLAAGFLL